MALIQVNHFSETVKTYLSMNVILPEMCSNPRSLNGWRSDGKFPVLWLLHGMNGNHTVWQRYSGIERYAAGLGLAVIMPSAEQGRYTDMLEGYDFYSYLADELPETVRALFPRISTEREDTFIAGLSMGGFGAFKLALDRPERFSAAASLSGALDAGAFWRDGMDSETLLANEYAWGSKENMLGGINDIPFMLDKRINEGTRLPKLYQCCGTEDFLYDINIEFRDKFINRTDLTYFEEPGDHDWLFWDNNIKRVLDWLPIEKRGSY